MKIENLTNLLPSQPGWSAQIEYSNKDKVYIERNEHMKLNYEER
jgi:hypothetical protein